MATKRLLEPILEGGIRFTHFFNGRVLTAEDLRAEQEASLAQRQQLGRAIGDGVVSGLEVRAHKDNTVLITRGLAIARSGHPVSLGQEVRLDLVPEAQTAPAGAGLFHDCATPTASSVSIGQGAYILTVSPASGFEGRAPMAGVQSTGQITGCGSRFVVEGVQFRLIRLEYAQHKFSGPRLRSQLAHWCLGTPALAAALKNPLAAPAPASADGGNALEWLRQSGTLTEREVPLALIHWQNTIQFIDLWAVRRRAEARLTPEVSAAPFAALIDPRRMAVAEAVYLQFQEQVEQLRQKGEVSTQPADSQFAYLPPAGILPLTPGKPVTFFNRFRQQQPYKLDPAFLRPLLYRSLYAEPISLGDEPGLLPPIGLYQPEGQAYLVFARRLRK